MHGRRRHTYCVTMRLAALAAVVLFFAAAVAPAAAAPSSDSMPDDASDVCGITTEDLFVMFVGDGATDTCQAKAHPVDIGPGG